MTVIEHEAMEVIRARWRLAGLAGPSVAHAEAIVAALNEAGMLCASDSDLRGAVKALERIAAMKTSGFPEVCATRLGEVLGIARSALASPSSDLPKET